ncbi:MAG: FlgO family outer membrane protein, partial [Chthoniobacterales bacterium]
MNLLAFFTELKRRNVYRVAAAYAVVAWLLIQIATQVFPFFDIPNWAVRLVVVLLLIGFPVALVLAWVFELTPEGIKRTEEVLSHESIRHHTGRRIVGFTVVLALLAAGLLAYRLARPGATGDRTDAAAAQEAISGKSIAVLPFENLSSDKENAFFTDGMQDEIRTNLAKIAELKVISRTSVMHYGSSATRNNLQEIAQALNVAYVVEGSVQRSANRVRVSAQLINARNDTHVWGEKYDRDLADVFAIQSEIAQAIADQLQAKLSPNEKKAIEQSPTNDLAAFDLYSRAKSLLLTAGLGATSEPDLRKAVELLDQAVKRDPSFFDAYCQLALAHETIYAVSGFDHTPARLALAEAG